jgi:MFS family permease
MSSSSATLTRTAAPERLLGVLLAAPFLAQMDATIANVATPSIHARLHASGAELELTIGAYLVSYAMLLVTGARLGQTHGYRRVFVVGIATFTLASPVAGLAPSPLVLIAARAVQGAGGALMFPQALTGIQLHFLGAERVRAIARYAVALSSGAVTGQLLGGVLVSADLFGSGWRSIFLINVPVGAAVIAAAFRFMPDDGRRTGRELDLRGVGSLSAAVLLAVLPLVLGPYQGWPTWTWCCLAASLPALGLFVAVERRVASAGRAPLLDFAVLGVPSVARGILVMAVATGTYYALLFTLAQYLQVGTGHSALDSGLMVVPWVAAFGLSGQLNRRLRDVWAARMPFVGCAVLAAVYVAISVDLLRGDHGQARLAVLLGVGGFALGIQFNATIAQITGAVSERHAPDVTGASSMLIQIAGVMAIAAFGTLYVRLAHRSGSSVDTATHAFAVTVALFAIAALVAALVAWPSGLTRRRRTAPRAGGAGRP